MKKKQRKEVTDKKFAPGIDDAEELNQNANRTELKKGEYTEVTTLSYDEVDPS